MDPERFDGLVRSFGQARSRRHALRGLAGVAAAGALALGGQEAAAGSRIGGSRCDRDRQCATGTCLGSGRCSCSAKQSDCKQPNNPCKSAACNTTTKTCETENKGPGFTCTTSTCQDGTCTCQDGTCTSCAQSCAGCCDGTACSDGDIDSVCGSGGGACISCDPGQRCAAEVQFQGGRASATPRAVSAAAMARRAGTVTPTGRAPPPRRGLHPVRPRPAVRRGDVRLRRPELCRLLRRRGVQGQRRRRGVRQRRRGLQLVRIVPNLRRGRHGGRVWLSPGRLWGLESNVWLAR